MTSMLNGWTIHRQSEKGNHTLINMYINQNLLLYVVSAEEVCGCPIVTNVFEETVEFCKAPKRRCNILQCFLSYFRLVQRKYVVVL